MTRGVYDLPSSDYARATSGYMKYFICTKQMNRLFEPKLTVSAYLPRVPNFLPWAMKWFKMAGA